MMLKVLKIKNKGKSSGEKGQVLIIALMLLALGVIIVPLLSFMASSYKTTEQVYNEKARELYAADAGVRDAMWNIQRKVSWLPAAEGEISSQQSISAVNGKTVTYTLARLPDSTYQATAYSVQSRASDPVSSRSTTITSHITVVDFSTTYTQNALTSPGEITTNKNDRISGNVQAPVVDGSSDGTINAELTNGVVINSPVMGWPRVTSTNNPVARFYFKQVSHLAPFTGATIDLSQTAQQGPLYATGNSIYTMQGNGSLQGIIYVDGSLDVPNDTTVNLNSQTIFVTGDMKVWPNSVINGPGAIIALGNIDYQPNHTNGQYIYLMSISGTINFQPNSNFTGSIAGQANLNLQPNNIISWTDPGGLNLNLPEGSNIGIGSIQSWRIQ